MNTAEEVIKPSKLQEPFSFLCNGSKALLEIVLIVTDLGRRARERGGEDGSWGRRSRASPTFPYYYQDTQRCSYLNLCYHRC